jgi:lysozyme
VAGSTPRRDLSRALALVRAFEGCRLRPYLDAVSIVTIGYGHVIHGDDGAPLRGRTGLAIANRRYPVGLTQAEASALLASDFGAFVQGVAAAVKVPLTDDQLGALSSFAFNVGLGALRQSTLLRRLNAGQYDAVPGELAKWTRAGGTVLQGLIRRRKAEAALWRGQPWQ